jgi:DNA polymerase I-like protein with 3'-5' exonuclease and polymerase domains
MSQAELRVLTWLAKEELTRDIFNDPSRDLFVELCRSMFPERYPPTLTDKEVKKLSSMEKPGEPSIRTLVKTFAYGIAYGRTAAGIASDPQFNMDVRIAQKHMKVFEKTIPNIIGFLEDAADRACRGEDLVTAFGRHRRFHLVTSQNKHAVRNEAKSFYAQSTASDIVLEDACRLTKQGVYIVNLVHDAIYADHPKDEAEEVKGIIMKEMVAVGEEVTEGYVKFATEGKIGRSWADV